jgi:hypothetical protein
VYLPDLPKAAYQELLDSFEREFTYTFGGCTVVRDLAGSYLSRHGLILKDRIQMIFTDTSLIFSEDLENLSRYTDHLRHATFIALQEEAVLVVAYPVYHSEDHHHA